MAEEEAEVGASVTVTVVVGARVLDVEGLAFVAGAAVLDVERLVFVVGAEPAAAGVSGLSGPAVVVVLVVALVVDAAVVGRIVSVIEVRSDTEPESAPPVVVSMEATALWMATGDARPGDWLSSYPATATANSPKPQANPRVVVMLRPNTGRRDTAPDCRSEPDGAGQDDRGGGAGRGGGGGGGLSTKMLLRFRGPETRLFLQVAGRYQAEPVGVFG